MRSGLRFIGFTTAGPRSVDFSSRSRLANLRRPSATLSRFGFNCPRVCSPSESLRLHVLPAVSRRTPSSCYLPRFRPSSRLPVRSSTSCGRTPKSVGANQCHHPLDPGECRPSSPTDGWYPPNAEKKTLLILHPTVLPPSDADEYRYLPIPDPCCHVSDIGKHRYLPAPRSVATSRMPVSIAAYQPRAVLPPLGC
jgi:hypothetical protein